MHSVAHDMLVNAETHLLYASHHLGLDLRDAERRLWSLGSLGAFGGLWFLLVFLAGVRRFVLL